MESFLCYSFLFKNGKRQKINPLFNLQKYATLSIKVYGDGIHESEGIVWHGLYLLERRILRR